MTREMFNIELNGKEFELFYRAAKEMLRQEEKEWHGPSGERVRARKLFELLEENRKSAHNIDFAGSETVAFEFELGPKELLTAYEATAEAVKSHFVLDEAKIIYRRLRIIIRRLFKKTELGKRTNLAA